MSGPDTHDDAPAPADLAAPDPDPTTTDDQEPGRGRRALGLLGRYWATTTLVAVIVVAGVATGALWNNVETGSSLYDQVAYGLPALQDGRVHTFLFGMFFSPQLVIYVPILALLVLAASAYERRVGHVRTLVVCVGGQFLAALVTALLLWPFDGSGLDLGRGPRPCAATSGSPPAASPCSAPSPR